VDEAPQLPGSDGFGERGRLHRAAKAGKRSMLTAEDIRRTGPDLRAAGVWLLDRDPYLLETSVPGIFACGDVRNSPVKRVAAAVKGVCRSRAERLLAAVLEDLLQRGEVVVDPALDREPCELWHECSSSVELDLSGRSCRPSA
jgi:hypothetical protein